MSGRLRDLIRFGPLNGPTHSKKQKQEVAADGDDEKTRLPEACRKKSDLRRFIPRHTILQGDLRSSSQSRKVSDSLNAVHFRRGMLMETRRHSNAR